MYPNPNFADHSFWMTHPIPIFPVHYRLHFLFSWQGKWMIGCVMFAFVLPYLVALYAYVNLWPRYKCVVMVRKYQSARKNPKLCFRLWLASLEEIDNKPTCVWCRLGRIWLLVVYLDVCWLASSTRQQVGKCIAGLFTCFPFKLWLCHQSWPID